MVTATDFHNAQLLDQSKIDCILVGDSMAMTALGHENTLPLTVDQLIYHCQAVKRASQYSFLIGDMPFGSYEISSEQALANCIRVVKESGMNGIKLEGGARVAKQVNKIAECGIPVFCHIGLTPQSINSLGGFKVQGKSVNDAELLLKDAKALQDAGASFLILECIPEEISRAITDSLQIPTIGIGAGVHASGQVLVFHDLLGMYQKFTPKFCKQYAQLNPIMKQAIQQYKQEVEMRQFPSAEHTYKVKPDIVTQFYTKIGYKLPSTSSSAKQIEFKESKPVVGICGAGSIGTVMATVLSQTNNVLLMESQWQLAIHQIQQYGTQMAHVKSKDLQIVSTNDFSKVASNELLQQMDCLIICCKGYQLNDYLPAIKQIVNTNPNCTILILTNGLGNVETISQQTNAKNIIQGTCYFGAMIQKDNQQLAMNVTLIGNNTKITTPNPNAKLKQVIESSGVFLVDDSSSQSFDQVVWQKVIVNCVINPLTFLLECTNGKLKEMYAQNDTQVTSLMNGLIDETLMLCKTYSIPLQQWDRQFYVNKVLDTCQDTFQNRSSMLTDWDKKSDKTEIDNLNGYILQMASAKQLSVPYHQSIVALVKSKSTLNKK